MNYLRELPVDYVSIDGALIQSITKSSFDRMMLKSIVEATKTLGIGAIAKKVDDKNLIQELAELGIAYGQGAALAEAREFEPEINPDSEKVAV